MLDKFLSNEEKKLFSAKTLKKMKKQDYESFIEMEEAILESLKSQYAEDKNNNRLLEANIRRQEEYVAKVKKFFVEIVLLSSEPVHDEIDDATDEYESMIKEIDKIQK
ncbi:hypothetical protein [Spiroplasma diminutum]|uniref:Uncharacterized protein n=1 Tax=Spiroplasma diminutum CUAS-1 TaxID=1276221 RepID=S5LWT2_9MOLU|nr:hypothetical protein [Spiroplasma diminutum]AGR42224.1 hypothetical protein SDIMI_v3c05200 [Spiroplasma diminutum CUAS-1]